MRIYNATALISALLGLAGWAANKAPVEIKEYDVPSPNARPHDPAVGPDGSLWVTEQRANKLGRLNPKTGEFREYLLKTPDSGPHGLIADDKGNVWFTAISKGYVGRLDPKRGDITEYRMPDPKARDPHTPTLDESGIVWFTLEQSGFVGRLDPKTGEVKVKEVPTPHAVPYGIVVVRGVPYFCEFGSNKLASIDPKTMAIHADPTAAAQNPAGPFFIEANRRLNHYALKVHGFGRD